MRSALILIAGPLFSCLVFAGVTVSLVYSDSSLSPEDKSLLLNFMTTVGWYFLFAFLVILAKGIIEDFLQKSREEHS